MKKKLMIILAISYMCMNMSGCDDSSNSPLSEGEMNVLKELYTEDKKHREDSFDLEEGTNEIEVNIKVSSGEFKVIFIDKDNESLSYEYDVKKGEKVNDTIKIDSDTINDDWVLVTEKNKDTDASLKYVLKK